MTKNRYLILGTIFLLASGLIYTLERIAAYILRNAQVSSGSWPSDEPTFFDPLLQNPFVAGFIVITVIAFIMAASEEDRAKTKEGADS